MPCSTALRRSTATVAAVVVMLGLAACGGDDEPSGDPPPGPGSSEPTEPSTSATSEPAEPSGPQITGPSLTLTLPAGWETRRLTGDTQAASPEDAPVPITVYVDDFEVSSGGEALPLSYLAREQRRVEGEDPPPEVLPETEIAGEPVFHIGGDIGKGAVLHLDSFGPSVPDRSVVISFEINTFLREQRREQIIEKVLAGVEWTF